MAVIQRYSARYRHWPFRCVKPRRAAARARGRLGGRPAKLSPERTRLAQSRYKARDVTVAEIARALGVGRGTIYRALQQTP